MSTRRPFRMVLTTWPAGPATCLLVSAYVVWPSVTRAPALAMLSRPWAALIRGNPPPMLVLGQVHRGSRERLGSSGSTFTTQTGTVRPSGR